MSTMENAEAAWPRYRDTHPVNNTPEQRHAFIAGYFAARIVAEEPEWEPNAQDLLDAIYDPDEDNENHSVRFRYVIEQLERLRGKR